MGAKKYFGLITLMLAAFILTSFSGSIGKKLVGHWTCGTDLYEAKVNDTLIFIKTKYTDKLYQWSGALGGIELSSDRHFSEFHNVLCSSESSQVRFADEKWNLHNDLITIRGQEREAAWRILNINSKKMTIVVLNTSNK